MPTKTSSNSVSSLRFRKRLLFKLANTRDDEIDLFRGFLGVRFPQEADRFYLNYRDALREAWPQSVANIEKKQSLVDKLIHQSVILFANVGFIAPLTVGRITAAPQNLLGQLAVAVLENWRRFRVCGNPECELPYFLAKRHTQKYCKDKRCVNYARRLWALEYWNKKGRERRANRTQRANKKSKGTQPTLTGC